MRYEIDQENVVRIFYPDSNIASIYQPTWPNGDEWLNSTEASLWAEFYIASVNDENAPYAPNSREEDGIPKPTAEEIIALQAKIEIENNISY
jgi:hypothetical protein